MTIKPGAVGLAEAKPVIKLLDDRVLVRVDEKELRSGALWLPENYSTDDQALQSGVVVACGPGSYDKFGNFTPIDVLPGDRILFHWSATHRAKKGKHGGEFFPDDSHVIMTEAHIKCVIESAAA